MDAGNCRPTPGADEEKFQTITMQLHVVHMKPLPCEESLCIKRFGTVVTRMKVSCKERLTFLDFQLHFPGESGVSVGFATGRVERWAVRSVHISKGVEPIFFVEELDKTGDERPGALVQLVFVKQESVASGDDVLKILLSIQAKAHGGCSNKFSFLTLKLSRA
jgi:hypothetical protein